MGAISLLLFLLTFYIQLLQRCSYCRCHLCILIIQLLLVLLVVWEHIVLDKVLFCTIDVNILHITTFWLRQLRTILL